jgi:hypothetical protein
MNDEYGRKIALFLFTSLTVITAATYGYKNLAVQKRYNAVDEKFEEFMRKLNDPNTTPEEREAALAEFEEFMDSL